jgi:hypothetical protein
VWTSCDKARYRASLGSKRTTKNTDDELDGKCLENVGRSTYLPDPIRPSLPLQTALCCRFPCDIVNFLARRALSPGWASESVQGPAVDCFWPSTISNDFLLHSCKPSHRNQQKGPYTPQIFSWGRRALGISDHLLFPRTAGGCRGRKKIVRILSWAISSKHVSRLNILS